MENPNEILMTALISTAVLLSVANSTLLFIRSKVGNIFWRAIISAAIVLSFLLSAGIADSLLMALNTTHGAAQIHIDPEPWIMWFPGVIALCATLAVAQTTQQRKCAS